MSVHPALLTVRRRRRVMDVDRGEDAIYRRDVIKAPDLQLQGGRCVECASCLLYTSDAADE